MSSDTLLSENSKVGIDYTSWFVIKYVWLMGVWFGQTVEYLLCKQQCWINRFCSSSWRRKSDHRVCDHRVCAALDCFSNPESDEGVCDVAKKEEYQREGNTVGNAPYRTPKDEEPVPGGGESELCKSRRKKNKKIWTVIRLPETNRCLFGLTELFVLLGCRFDNYIIRINPSAHVLCCSLRNQIYTYIAL